jgi:dTDP-4-dehydrorhamnose 3,5-epimerase-like enzyme
MTNTPIKDCYILNTKNHKDERGFFCELHNDNNPPVELLPGRELKKDSCLAVWKQVNCSKSRNNVIRGLHIAPFAKLV